MFKANWEKTSTQHQLPENIILQMVQLAYPNGKLLSHELIVGGCANLNIKILLEGETRPLILRVYLRDKSAPYREQKLGALLKPTIPVPLILHIDNFQGYTFAITEFIPGIALRDLLLSDTPRNIRALLYDVGVILSKITAHRFPHGGFFDKNLGVIPHTPSDDYITFAKDCLKNETVLSVLTPQMISRIEYCFGKYKHLFPNKDENHLVHADFDPANIIVDQINGVWKISGILDWEFSFSGSMLCDIANMLRYAHKMPPDFQEAFLNGLTSSGIILPENWLITIKLLNLASLLDCLQRSEPENQPNQCLDIQELIEHILSKLEYLKQTQNIEIIPYNPEWPNMFEIEAANIKVALGDNCITIYHIGSTSVPGLAAKPIIDMLPVVKNISAVDKQNLAIAALGYVAKGEYGIPFRRYFQKRADLKYEGYNIHVFEQGNLEIDRYIKFRDWMRQHPSDRDAYADLKKFLVLKFPNDINSYTKGKDKFIASIDAKADLE